MSDTDRRTAMAMIGHGGSFVKALGELAMKADACNLAIIKASFAVYWQHYSELGAATRKPGSEITFTNQQPST